MSSSFSSIQKPTVSDQICIFLLVTLYFQNLGPENILPANLEKSDTQLKFVDAVS